MQQSSVPLLVNGKNAFPEQPRKDARQREASAVGYLDMIFADGYLCFYIPRTEQMLFRKRGSFPVKTVAGILFPEHIVGCHCDFAGCSHENPPVVITEAEVENGSQNRQQDGHNQGSFNSEASPMKEKL
jgi:hypothetical protein